MRRGALSVCFAQFAGTSRPRAAAAQSADPKPTTAPAFCLGLTAPLRPWQTHPQNMTQRTESPFALKGSWAPVRLGRSPGQQKSAHVACVRLVCCDVLALSLGRWGALPSPHGGWRGNTQQRHRPPLRKRAPWQRSPTPSIHTRRSRPPTARCRSDGDHGRVTCVCCDLAIRSHTAPWGSAAASTTTPASALYTAATVRIAATI